MTAPEPLALIEQRLRGGATRQAMERDAAADLVDTALLAAALTAYENARMDGLCHAGAWECALTILQGAKTDERR